jgi:hypothetical protein
MTGEGATSARAKWQDFLPIDGLSSVFRASLMCCLKPLTGRDVNGINLMLIVFTCPVPDREDAPA